MVGSHLRFRYLEEDKRERDGKSSHSFHFNLHNMNSTRKINMRSKDRMMHEMTQE